MNLDIASNETMVADTAVKPEQRTLVLTAFPAEADAILARTTLDENPVVVVHGRHCYLGTLGGKKVVVAMTGIGMKNAADTTEDALTHFMSRRRRRRQTQSSSQASPVATDAPRSAMSPSPHGGPPTTEPRGTRSTPRCSTPQTNSD